MWVTWGSANEKARVSPGFFICWWSLLQRVRTYFEHEAPAQGCQGESGANGAEGDGGQGGPAADGAGGGEQGNVKIQDLIHCSTALEMQKARVTPGFFIFWWRVGESNPRPLPCEYTP